MKRLLFISLCVLGTGCAANRPATADRSRAADQYESAEAAALAFDSPVTPDYALPGLDRGPREPWAFAGYEDSVTEYYSVSVGDQQSTDPWNNVYDRISISQKVGVRYR